MSQWSRLPSRVCTYSSPLTSPGDFIQDIKRIIRCTGVHFVLPCHDETEVIARWRDSLPHDVLIPIPNYTNMRLANDKLIASQTAMELGIPVPKLIEASNVQEMKDRLSSLSDRLVVKLRRGNSAKGVFYPASKDEVVPMCETLVRKFELAPDRFPIVQERVQGDGWGVSALYWQGKEIASFTHRRLREKTPTGGTSTLRVSQRNPLLESLTRRLLDGLGWHGLAMVEYKVDPVSKQSWFIEINPRLWGSIGLAIAAGVDFPYLLYVAATEGSAAASAQTKAWNEGVVARWYMGDLIVAFDRLRSMDLVGGLKLLAPGNADVIDDWSLRDPLAFVGEALYYARGFLRTGSTNPQEGAIG